MAVKDAPLAPAATETDSGTLTFALFEVTDTLTVLVVFAASATEHVAVAAPVKTVGVQERDATPDVDGTGVTAVCARIGDPFMDTAATAVNASGFGGIDIPAVTLMLAITPLAMVLRFSPNKRHVSLPVDGKHVAAFPAAVAAGPAVTVTDWTDPGYVSVHCKAAGFAPPDSVSGTVVVIDPGMLPSVSVAL